MIVEHPMIVEQMIALVQSLAWPVTVLVIVLIYRKQLGLLMGNIKELEGPGGIRVALKNVNATLERVEQTTKFIANDIYNVTGEAHRVREQVWQEVAAVLESVSNSARTEMQQSLTAHHLKGLGVSASEVKEQLNMLGYYDCDHTEAGGISEEVSPEFCHAVADFQTSADLEYVDGVLGPNTLQKLRQEVRRQSRVVPGEARKSRFP